MKKSLLGSTAIVGASLLLAGPAVAQGPEVSLDGYLAFEVWFDDQDTAFDDAQDYYFRVDDAEIRFNAKATADNGLTWPQARDRRRRRRLDRRGPAPILGRLGNPPVGRRGRRRRHHAARR